MDPGFGVKKGIQSEIELITVVGERISAVDCIKSLVVGDSGEIAASFFWRSWMARAAIMT
jgi:hypothetical protein